MEIFDPNKLSINTKERTINKLIELERNSIFIQNNEEIQLINLNDIFKYERDNCTKYNIYGKLDFTSILNNLKLAYLKREDFFERYTKEQAKTIYNSFDIYLLHKHNEYETYGDKFVEKYIVVGKPKDINIYDCSFSKNIFYENSYLFNTNKLIDIKDRVDGFNKPITEFYIYFKYKKASSQKVEHIYSRVYDENSDSDNNNKVEEKSEKTYEYGDIISGSLIEIDGFDEKVINRQDYSIELFYDNENRIIFNYNPFVEIKIKDYSSNVNFVNEKLNKIINIPIYAQNADTFGNYIWRDILEYGFIDPTSGNGFDFPFINNQHYVYNNIQLIIKPDVTDAETRTFFDDITIKSYNSNLYRNNPLKINQTC